MIGRVTEVIKDSIRAKAASTVKANHSSAAAWTLCDLSLPMGSRL
jgi:hypothetical protein